MSRLGVFGMLAFVAATATAFSTPSNVLRPAARLPLASSRNNPSITSLKALDLTILKYYDIPSGFGAIMSTAAVSAGVVQWAAIQVAVARKKYGVKYPKMYEGTAGSVFDCVQRAHQNTLEYLPSFLALLMLNGFVAPYTTAAIGMIWNVGRIFYVLGYGKGDPNGRLPGAAVSGIAFLLLIVATFINGIRVVV